MRMNKSMTGLLAGAALLLGPALGRADEHNQVVVELFTSQGCSSCPPADELLRKLATRQDVLPLALHVDYWDYIGWADDFARPENTKRQKAYAHAAGSRSIYTPQMVIGGVEQVVGARPMEVIDAVMAHLQDGPEVELQAVRDGDVLKITAEPPEKPTGRLKLQLVRYMPEQVVNIERGENAGRTLRYANIVTDWDVIGEWSAETPLDVEIPLPGDDAAAVLLQEAGFGEIVAAVKLP